MSGAMPTGQNRVFQDRLKRIEAARAPDPVDLLDADGNPVPHRTEVSPLPDWKKNLIDPAGMAGAVVAGMIAVFVVRLARYHLLGSSLDGGDSADLTMLIDAGAAGLLSFVAFSLLPFEGAKFKAAQTLGIVIMISTMHNMVHAAPGLFSLAFSPQWTEEAIAATEPKSILFRGVSFKMMEEEEPVVEEPEKKMPVIRRMG